MPKYETMLITSAALDEEASVALVGKFKSLIEANGSIDAVEDWGKRRFAYEINKQNEGVYTLIHFTAPPDFPAELDRVYKITDGVVRSIIVVKAPGQEAPVPQPAQPEASAAEVPAKEEPKVEAKAEEPAEAPVAEEPAEEEPAAEKAAEPAAEA